MCVCMCVGVCVCVCVSVRLRVCVPAHLLLCFMQLLEGVEHSLGGWVCVCIFVSVSICIHVCRGVFYVVRVRARGECA